MMELKKNEDKRRKKNREEVKTIESMEKKERTKQRNSDVGKKVFCLWKFWIYCLLLQK